LTRATVFREFISHGDAAKLEPGDMGPETVRCRVLVSEDRTESFWRSRNGLGEEEWAGGFCDLGARAEEIGKVRIDQHLIQGMAFRALAWMLMGKLKIPSRVDTIRELPNGAIVFDLGTV
jgi:hypothetical protein